MPKKDRTKLFCLVVFITGVGGVLITNNRAIRTTRAYATGPPAGSTGAPFESTCANCHFGPSNNGQFTITTPQTYVPGQTYQVAVTHTNSDPTRRQWGFELTALDAANNKAGNLQSLNAFAQILNNDGPGGNRQYVEHTLSGTFAGQVGGANWTFNWTAPPSDAGTVTFYASGNQANGDGQPSGDQIYATSASIIAAPTPTPTPTPSTVQFSAANYNVNEGGSATVTVTRTGDTSGVSTVDFGTANSSFAPCDVFNGVALQNCDFTVASGKLTFNANETSKTFSVLTTDDAYVEGNETFSVTLSNPSGATLGSPNPATVTISDNDTAGSPSIPRKQFVANLTGAQEVPPTNNAVIGNGGVVKLSTDETSANVSLIFAGLSGNETGAHIHGPAGPGTDAAIIFPLPLGSPIINFQINPSVPQVADLKAGMHYMNVHSATFSNGEIRGQLLWNPLEETTFFVQQQYADFLSRVPDDGGLAFWSAEINQCISDVVCLRNRRVNVSNAFFFEPEFQQTGSYVVRLYRAAYGNSQPFPNPDAQPMFPGENLKFPSYAVFVRDRARVVGGANLAQAQLDLANDFVQRTEFLNKYPASLATGAQFVDAVLATLQNDLSVNLISERTNLIDLFNQGGRGLVMYRLADDNMQTNPINNRAFVDAEYNRAFVTAEYFGYLRRDGDIGGLLFWLGQVNGAPLRDADKQHAMVCSFITSIEYQLRFGSIVTRNNNECPQ